MFKDLSSIAAKAVGQAAAPADRDGAERTANRVFKALQGMYGNLFLSKFATGKVENGHDSGVMGARDVWAMALRPYDLPTVSLALESVLADYPEFPPSLPQFIALCRARQTRKTFAEEQGVPLLPGPKLEPVAVQIEAKGDGRDWARKLVARAEAGDRLVTQGVLAHARAALRKTWETTGE